MGYYDELAASITCGMNKNQLARLKTNLCRKHRKKDIPTDIEIFLNLPSGVAERLRRQLQTKPTRSISGITSCAIMSYPFRCPHGECLMCPGRENIPQSYTGKEPAAMRGKRNNYDPYLQVMNRIEQYVASGHIPDKMELIIMGGTFPSFKARYQDEFIMYALKAMNDFSRTFYRGRFMLERYKRFFLLPGKLGDEERCKAIITKLLKMKGSSSLEKEQKRNERSRIRCVGMTIETRPDYATLKHANKMLAQGCTRVELGLQSTYDDVLQAIGRGHDFKDSVDAIRTLRDLGLKINLHVMPGLPGSDLKRDAEMLRQLFDDERLRPDMLKIYPCMVVPGSRLHELWKKGRFTPITTDDALDLISEWKTFVPQYCRIMRVQRDIPTSATAAGVDRTNLRQLIQERMRKAGKRCRCIRCREAGRNISKGRLTIVTMTYSASGGLEHFISAEKGDSILGFCRLRQPALQLRKEFDNKTMIIRELHVYGETAGIGECGKIQHRGLGKKLLSAAEKIAAKSGCMRLLVISGIGARDYYRKLGYVKYGPYMAKRIKAKKALRS
jgi:elongator complex protein 3